MKTQDDVRPEEDRDLRFNPLTTPYAVREKDFPHGGTLEEQFMFLVHYAVIAPSTHNTQPWKFAVSREGIEVYGDYTRRMPVVDAGNRELLMSIGAAVYNVRVAAAHFGLSCRVDFNLSGSSEQPLAFLRLAPAPSRTPGDHQLDSLFPSLITRHTTRNPFLLTRIPASILQHVTGMQDTGRATLQVSTDGALNTRVAELVAEAEEQQLASMEFRKDLAGWIRPEGSEHDDGLPGDTLGLGGTASRIASHTTRTLDLGKQSAARDKNLCQEAPGLVVVLCEDDVPHWLDAGELLERLLLTVTREGLQFSYFNMPIQVPEFRVRLRALLQASSWPQLLLRIGYSLITPPRTPRRPLDEVLIRKYGF